MMILEILRKQLRILMFSNKSLKKYIFNDIQEGIMLWEDELETAIEKVKQLFQVKDVLLLV